MADEQGEYTPQDFTKTSKGKPWKTRDTRGGNVRYWDEYTFNGNTYHMEELDGDTEIALLGIFSEAGFTEFNLTSIGDMVKMGFKKFLALVMRPGVITKMLALVLKRKTDDGLVPCTPEEFGKAPARLLNPFVKEITSDFFYLNSELLTPIIEFGQSFLKQAGVYQDLLANLNSSITYAADELKGSK